MRVCQPPSPYCHSLCQSHPSHSCQPDHSVGASFRNTGAQKPRAQPTKCTCSSAFCGLCSCGFSPHSTAGACHHTAAPTATSARLPSNLVSRPLCASHSLSQPEPPAAYVTAHAVRLLANNPANNSTQSWDKTTCTGTIAYNTGFALKTRQRYNCLLYPYRCGGVRLTSAGPTAAQPTAQVQHQATRAAWDNADSCARLRVATAMLLCGWYSCAETA